ncbi:MAG: hypothetical protein HGB37_01995 [Candidatus Moranbacteria bacterium]|nr:hypothetical protein [Candidatus Moranbacteria bacterium]
MTKKILPGHRILLVGASELILQINLTQPPTTETLTQICYKAQSFEGFLSTGSILTVAQDGRKLFFRFRTPGPEVVFPAASWEEQESVLLVLSRNIGIGIKTMRRNKTTSPRFPNDFFTIPEVLTSLGIGTENDSHNLIGKGNATLAESFFKKQE